MYFISTARVDLVFLVKINLNSHIVFATVEDIMTGTDKYWYRPSALRMMTDICRKYGKSAQVS